MIEQKIKLAINKNKTINIDDNVISNKNDYTFYKSAIMQIKCMKQKKTAMRNK